MIHVHIDKEAAKSGAPCITVSRAECGTPVASGRHAVFHGEWHLHQHDEQQPCGASIVLSPGVLKLGLHDHPTGDMILDGQPIGHG